MEIKDRKDFQLALDYGPYAWPGGYPTFFIMEDGAALCFNCAKEEGKPGGPIDEAFDDLEEYGLSRHHDGWMPIGYGINYEDEDAFCAHCNKQIESAYGGG